MFKLTILGKRREVPTRRLIFVISGILLLTIAMVLALALPVGAEPEAVFTGCLNQRSGELHKVAMGLEPFIACSPAEVQVSWDRGVPALEGLIAALEERIGKVESDLAPLDLTVNCPVESVGEALAQAGERTAHVTITVVGVCTEEVVISRDNTTLRGASPGDGLEAPSADSTVLMLRARGISLEQLTLTGGDQGILATDGASFDANNLFVSETSHVGVFVEGNSVGELSDSSVEDTGGFGLIAEAGGAIRMFGGVIKTNISGVLAEFGGHVSLIDGTMIQNTEHVGIEAREGGSVLVSNGTVEGSNGLGVFALSGGNVTITDESLIQNNVHGGVDSSNGSAVTLQGGTRVANNLGHGVSVRSGGSVTIQDAVIESNGNDGVSLGGGSTARLENGAIVRNNIGHGIALGATSAATFFDDTVQIIGNTGTAVICGPSGLEDVAEIVGEPGTISGNGSDTIECPRGFP